MPSRAGLALNGATIEEAGFSSGIRHIRRSRQAMRRLALPHCFHVAGLALMHGDAESQSPYAKTFTNLLNWVTVMIDGDENQAIDSTNPFTWREFS
jgi:hypothetical protein